MNRRRLIAVLGTSTLVVPVAALPQQAPGKVPRVGLLLFNSPQTDPIAPLLEGLQALGYVDGKTIGIEYRFAEGKAERITDLDEELVRLNHEVIFEYGGDVAQTEQE